MSLEGRIGAQLAAYGWTDRIDDILAAGLGCEVEDVAAVRRAHEQRAEALELARMVEGEALVRRADRLAGYLGWTGSRSALIVRMLDGAIGRVEGARAKRGALHAL